jgi:hypothetical protein
MDGSHAQVELAGVPDLTVWNEHGPVRPNVIGFQVERTSGGYGVLKSTNPAVKATVVRSGDI